jgi:hypothetical protein
MANMVGSIAWKITTLAIGIPVGIAVRKGLERAWVAARPESPPSAAEDPDVSWGDALVWAALSAIGVAVAQLITVKGASTVWRKLIGADPPPVARAKAEAEGAAA